MPCSIASVRQLVPVSVGDPMAPSTAAAAIPVLRDGTVFTTNMITFALEIIRMTGGTIRFVLGPAPGNSGADGIAVAAGTTRVIAMIARVVPVRIMAEVGRGPAVRRMAYVTLRRRR